MNKEEFNKILAETISEWKEYLKSLDVKMQSTLKKLLDEALKNKNVYALFFEYEYELLNTKFIAVDKFDNEIIARYDVLIDELNCKTMFPEKWLDKLNKIEFENRIYEEGFDKPGSELKWGYSFDEFLECWDDFEWEKNEIYEEWFQSCWNEIKKEYNKIPKAYFSIHDTNTRIDLSTGDEIVDNE